MLSVNIANYLTPGWEDIREGWMKFVWERKRQGIMYPGAYDFPSLSLGQSYFLSPQLNLKKNSS